MNKPAHIQRTLSFAVILVLLLNGCGAAIEEAPQSAATPTMQGENPAVEAAVPQARRSAQGDRPTRPVTATITLADGDIQIEGTGAQAEGSTLTITADGVYEIRGSLSDGQIIVNATDAAEVELLLAGVDITSSRNAAIYCMNADDFIVSLADDSENMLTDAANYTYVDVANEEPNAALFSKVDMNIGGGGSLTVNANFNHGISSKDDLVIESGQFTIHAVSHGIRGRDSLTVLDGSFTINAGGDAMQSSNTERADYGWVLLAGGQYDLQVSGDGIQAETALTIQGGAYNITTSGTPANDSTSQKGLKAGTILAISGGDFQINSIDDAVHSNIDAEIIGGTFSINTGDDGVHADRNLYIKGGTIEIPACYEGFEGTNIELSGGKHFINARNDAVSAAAGTEEAAQGPSRGGNDLVWFRITGGELEAVSGGDTVDSNGNIFVDGGMLRLSSPPRPSYEGALLCNGTVYFTGGNIALVGNIGVGVEVESQPLLLVSHPAEQAEGSVLSLRDQNGNTLLEVVSLRSYIQSAFSSPELAIGSTYGIYIDGEKKTDITLSDTITRTADDGGEFTGGYSRGQW